MLELPNIFDLRSDMKDKIMHTGLWVALGELCSLEGDSLLLLRSYTYCNDGYFFFLKRTEADCPEPLFLIEHWTDQNTLCTWSLAPRPKLLDHRNAGRFDEVQCIARNHPTRIVCESLSESL
jgi:hypothetical protein